MSVQKRKRESLSLAELTASLPEAERKKILNELPLSIISKYNWDFWGRPKQFAPNGDWFWWLILAGRGFGKTRTGTEWIKRRVKYGPYEPIAIIGQTKGDVRDTMIEGPGGILRNSSASERPQYIASKRTLIWNNGMRATLFSGDEPDQLRGPQHGTVWIDELAKFKYPVDTLDNAEFGLRLGNNPQGLITTTPRPLKVIRDLMQDSDVAVTTGNTYENQSNLSDRFIKRVIKKYEGTSLARQELHAEVLDEAVGSLWKRDLIERNRVRVEPALSRIGIGVDPNIKNSEGGDECGIVLGGRTSEGVGVVLEDFTTRGGPNVWGKKIADLYKMYGLDFVVVEGNQGGDMVREVIQQHNKEIPVYVRWHQKGKSGRAEPIVLLYEKGSVKHFGNRLGSLEDEMCNWIPGTNSPNRLDAMVILMTELLMRGGDVGVSVF